MSSKASDPNSRVWAHSWAPNVRACPASTDNEQQQRLPFRALASHRDITHRGPRYRHRPRRPRGQTGRRPRRRPSPEGVSSRWWGVDPTGDRRVYVPKPVRHHVHRLREFGEDRPRRRPLPGQARRAGGEEPGHPRGAQVLSPDPTRAVNPDRWQHACLDQDVDLGSVRSPGPTGRVIRYLR